MNQLLGKVANYLGYELSKKIAQETLKTLDDYMTGYGGWRAIVRKGIDFGINAALRALETAREEIVKFCKKNKDLLKFLSQIAIKSFVRLVTEVGAKSVVRALAKKGTKQIAVQSVKILGKVHPVGMAADVAQAGLEYLGYEDIGKKVGVAGNVTSGILLGAAVGGPPGAAIGAFGGFVVWGVGEVTGGLVERAFGK